MKRAMRVQEAIPALGVRELDSWRNLRTGELLRPDNIREIVLALLTGGNFRRYSEVYVGELTTIYASWIMQVVVEAKRSFGVEWREKLLELTTGTRNKDLLALRAWILTATAKTVVNLASEDTARDYLLAGIDENRRRVATHPWGDSVVTLCGMTSDDKTILDLDESTWLLRMVGSSTVAVRGAVKSTFGKRLERALLLTSFDMLGMRAEEHFRLNSPPHAPIKGAVLRGKRERDAVIVCKTKDNPEILLEMGLIGKGNSEVVNDKVRRVGRNGIVLHDKLPESTTVRGNAEELNIALIGLRERRLSSPVHELAAALKSRVSYTLKSPPEPAQFREILNRMDDYFFSMEGVRAALPEAVHEEAESTLKNGSDADDFEVEEDDS